MVDVPYIGHIFQQKQDLQDIFDKVMLDHSYNLRSTYCHLDFDIFHLAYHYRMLVQHLEWYPNQLKVINIFLLR